LLFEGVTAARTVEVDAAEPRISAVTKRLYAADRFLANGRWLHGAATHG